MVTLIVPDCPGSSTRGLNEPVPKVRIGHASPLSAAMAVSKGCMSATALVLKGTFSGAPFGYGPISDGTRTHSPHGTSRVVRVAATAFGPVWPANRSGEPVAPTPLPTSLKTSMLIGSLACARKATVPASGGTKVSAQPPCSSGPAQFGPVGSCTAAASASRASAKYSSVVVPLLVTRTGMVTGAALADSFTCGLFGRLPAAA